MPLLLTGTLEAMMALVTVSTKVTVPDGMPAVPELLALTAAESVTGLPVAQ